VGFCTAIGDIVGSRKWRGKILSLILLQRRAGRPGKLIFVTLSTFMFSFLFELVWSVPGHAQHLPDQCLDNLPTPTPIPPSHRVVQLVNCTYATLLGAANAAGHAGKPLTSVLPRENTWVMGPLGSGRNVLTIDIPVEWEDTREEGSVAPRLWARTGCRYDIESDRAQCETGGCGGKYDCSKAQLGASVGTTISEWTFYQPVSSGGISYFKDSPDISVVDGANLNMDIQPVGSSPTDPFDALGGHDIQWLAENYPLTKHGQDLRDQCLASFALKRSDLMEVPTAKGFPLYGFVIMDDSKQPVGGDRTIACFSNCGRYAFPAVPTGGASCDDSDKNSICYRWKSFCTAAPASTYTKKCTKDSDCPYGLACWDNPGSTVDHTCQGRAFIKNQTCSPNVCTFPYNYVDPKTGIQYKSTQPPFGHCTDITSDPDACIGDDTIHQVMPKAYSWANDPQVYGGDAPLYRVIFAPGNTLVPITEAGPIPVCSTLPSIYGYSDQYGGPGSGTKPCDIPVNQQGAIFAVAHPQPNNWACNLPPSGSGNEGPICRWKPGALFVPSPPPPRPH
jgi:hypothetical protein